MANQIYWQKLTIDCATKMVNGLFPASGTTALGRRSNQTGLGVALRASPNLGNYSNVEIRNRVTLNEPRGDERDHRASSSIARASGSTLDPPESGSRHRVDLVEIAKRRLFNGRRRHLRGGTKSRRRVERIGDGLLHGHDTQPSNQCGYGA